MRHDDRRSRPQGHAARVPQYVRLEAEFDARRAALTPAWRALEKEEMAAVAQCEREYVAGDLTVAVHPKYPSEIRRYWAVCSRIAGLQPTDLRLMADIADVVERWRAGELDELPPSGLSERRVPKAEAAEGRGAEMTAVVFLSYLASCVAIVMSVASLFVHRSNRRRLASSDECQCGHAKCFHRNGAHVCASHFCACQVFIPKTAVAELPGAKVISLPGRRAP